MIRCSRPMSWAVASTWPSGGRRSTQRRAGGVGDAEGEVRVAAGDQLEVERRRRPSGRARRTRPSRARRRCLRRLLGSTVPLGAAPVELARPSVETATLPVRAGDRRTPDRPLSCPGADRRDRCNVRDRGPRAVPADARRGRPVGAVVRPVPHARARSSSRWSTPPTARSCWPRSTSTRTRAIKAELPGAVHPGGLRGERRQGRRRVHRRPGPSARCRRSSTGCCPRPSETEIERLLGERRRGVAAPGARARSPTTTARSSRWPSCWSPTAAATRPSRCWPASPRRAETRRVAALARAGGDVADDDDIAGPARRAARPGQGRRRRPPGVRRPARAARSRRPPHGGLPPPPHRPPVLTPGAPPGRRRRHALERSPVSRSRW